MNKKQMILLLTGLICAVILSACTSANTVQQSGSSWPGISADGNVVFLAGGSRLEAVEAGDLKWTYPSADSSSKYSYYAAPLITGNHVILGTYSNQLQVLNKEDGSEVMTIEIGNTKNKVIASPIAAEGHVIVLSSGGMVSAYAMDNDQPLWQTTLSGELWVKPVYEDGKIYVAAMDKKMNVLDAESGKVLDSIPMSGAAMSDPVLSDGKIYFSTLAKEVDELDLASNSIRKVLETNGEIWAAPLIMGEKIIAADMNGQIYCANVTDGASLWTKQNEQNGFIAAPIALSDESFLLIDESGSCQVYDMEGKSVAERSTTVRVDTTPVLLESGSFAMVPYGANEQIKAYAADLKEDWTYVRQTDKKK